MHSEHGWESNLEPRLCLGDFQFGVTSEAFFLLAMLTNEMMVMVSAAAVVLRPCSTANGIT